MLLTEPGQRNGHGEILQHGARAVAQGGHRGPVFTIGDADDEGQHGSFTSAKSVWYARAMVVMEKARAT